jgi:hypothetical protein
MHTLRPVSNQFSRFAPPDAPPAVGLAVIFRRFAGKLCRQDQNFAALSGRIDQC